MVHTPVLIKEVLQYLDPKQNENFIDATIGGGGHAIEILKKNMPSGKLLGIDLDKSQIENSAKNLNDFKERIILVNDSYRNIGEIIKKVRFQPVNGILADIGFSSWHIEQLGRGFSFNKDEPLDMRYSDNNALTAKEIVNEYPEEGIEKMLRDFGEEKFAKQIAKKIIEIRKFKKIESTFELKNIIEESIPPKFLHGKIHFATKSFQAIRIAVNGEIDNLKEFLPQAIELLSNGGRLVIISFHSLEDRVVKNFFSLVARTYCEAGVPDLESEKSNKVYPVKSSQGEVSREAGQFNRVKILTKKPITASLEEVIKNPRARSAKLRAIIKI